LAQTRLTQSIHHEQETLTIADHAGSINGFGSYLARVLDGSSLVAVLENHRNDTSCSPACALIIQQVILSLVYGEPVQAAKISIAGPITLYHRPFFIFCRVALNLGLSLHFS